MLMGERMADRRLMAIGMSVDFRNFRAMRPHLPPAETLFPAEDQDRPAGGIHGEGWFAKKQNFFRSRKHVQKSSVHL